MKKQIVFIAFSLVLALSCSGPKGSETNDTTNLATQEESTVFTSCDKGIEPILLGMDVKDIPASVDGLYDNVTEFQDWEEFVDYRIYTFTLNSDTVIIAHAYDANYDKVFNIASIVIYPRGNVKIPEGKDYLSFYDKTLEPERPGDYD